MPIANYIRRPLVFNEIGKPINDISLDEAIKIAGLDYKVGIKETRVRLASPEDPDKFLLYKVPNNYATYREDTIKYLALLVLNMKLFKIQQLLILLIRFVIMIKK